MTLPTLIQELKILRMEKDLYLYMSREWGFLENIFSPEKQQVPEKKKTDFILHLELDTTTLNTYSTMWISLSKDPSIMDR